MSAVNAARRLIIQDLRWPLGAPSPSLLVPLGMGVAIGLPILFLLVNSFNVATPGQAPVYSLENWANAFADRTIWAALWNSLALGSVRTAIGLVLGVGFAWLIARTDLPGASIVEFLFRIELFVPSLPYTLGFILLLDPHYGLINDAVQRLPFVGGPIFNLYSFWGIIWVHLASAGVAFYVFLLTPLFRRMSAHLEEAGRTSGANQLTVLRRITLPVLLPGILGTTMLVFVRSLEAFEVELLLGPQAGIQVYSTKIYNLLRDDPPGFGTATALGSLFLLTMIGLALLYRSAIAGRDFTTVSGRGFSTARYRLGRLRWPALGLCASWMTMALLAPMVFLILGSFMRRYGFFTIADPYTLRNWERLLRDSAFLSSLKNSLVIAVSVGLVGMVVYSLIAYFVIRRRSAASTVVDALSWLPWAVPGILMSLGLLWLFLSTPSRTILYGSVLGIVLAIVIRDSPVSTQLMKAAVLQVGRELEESAKVSGASWLTMYRRVLFPLLAPTAFTVGLLAFAGALRDISTVVLLYSGSSRPLSILLLEYGISGNLEQSSALAIMLVSMIAVASVVGQRLGSRLSGSG
ncbi:MAG TPA: iron ABC transporter permease [Chloroflexota bacterium]|nr:iron ABC transporter permease [Chloroflexota bacterium]